RRSPGCSTRESRLGMGLFFSQAEDAIRAFHVTGVQTCALPICAGQRVGTAPSLFESPVLQPGEQWSFVFTEPGEYSFLCTVSAHQLMGMVGRIIVEELPPVANSASAR